MNRTICNVRRYACALPTLATLASCTGPAAVPPPNRPGAAAAPGAEPSDQVASDGEPSEFRSVRWPRAGKPALCERRLSAASGDLEREVERAIDQRAIRACHSEYLRSGRAEGIDQGAIDLSFTVDEGGRIVMPHTRGIDYQLAACIERAVEDACVGIIVDDAGTPTAQSFTIHMYLVP